MHWSCAERVGSRLRRLKNAHKGTKPEDEKGLAGKEKLTDGKIVVFQNYYGLAIRNNLNDVYQIAKDIKAALYHVASSNDNPQHQLCHKEEDSWCQNKKNPNTYKHMNGLPKCIVNLVERVVDCLRDRALLRKCDHWLTQNANEYVNG